MARARRSRRQQIASSYDGEAAEKLEGEYSEEIRVIEANLDD